MKTSCPDYAALLQAFYPAARISPTVKFGAEEILERVLARRAARG